MIRMRFAPSPTGVLHIGNARTAIFGYLLAKHYQGQFFLRIEDTDMTRSKQEYTDILIQSLKFLGINWDNDEIIYQSKRFAFYKQIAEKMVELGYAYKCYMTTEEIDAVKIQGKAFRSKYRDIMSDNINAIECNDDSIICSAMNEMNVCDNAKNDEQSVRSNITSDTTCKTACNISTCNYVIRFKVSAGITSFHDAVCDEVSINNDEIEDFVLLRSDGSPTFILCCAADDFDMKINYVLRGVDHLINTAKQIMIFKAMNWDVPKYAHIPLILDHTGKKLSKRDGDVGVLDYAKKGILPQAIINCLMRLGWGHKNEEFIPLEGAIEIFDETGFSKSSARFDEAKLLDLSGKYMRYLSEEQIYTYAREYAAHTMHVEYTDIGWKRFRKGLNELTARAKTLSELLTVGKIFLDDIRHDSESEIKTTLLDFFTITLPTQIDESIDMKTNVEKIELSFRQYCLSHGLIFGEVARVLRMRLSKANVSPGLFAMIYVLGADECISRL